jgi:DNA-binding MarR family transcriptional regulator
MTKTKFYVMKWMTSRLGLSGNELVAYAYLYEVTADGTKPYDGGYTELSEVMGTTIPTVYNTLKKLKERGFLYDDGGVRQDAKVIRVVPRSSLKVA